MQSEKQLQGPTTHPGGCRNPIFLMLFLLRFSRLNNFCILESLLEFNTHSFESCSKPLFEPKPVTATDDFVLRRSTSVRSKPIPSRPMTFYLFFLVNLKNFTF